MKNLFTKTLLLGGLAGSLVLGGCGDNSELEKYNLENKQVYEDFVEFVEENKDNGGFYSNKDNTRYANIYREKIFLVNKNKDMEIRFNDYKFNGMDDLDLYVENEIKASFKYLPLEKQLSVAQEYTNTLKEILHDEKFKNY